jgi:hypothetical protein
VKRRKEEIPGTSQTSAALVRPLPQRMSLEVVPMGLLLMGRRAQEEALSTPLTQSCCHVEWAAAEVARVRRAATLNFMVMVIPGGVYIC